MDRDANAPVQARGRRRRAVAWTLALVLVAALLAVGLAGRRASAGPPAPPLPRDPLAGGPITLAALLGAPATSPAGAGRRVSAAGPRASAAASGAGVSGASGASGASDPSGTGAGKQPAVALHGEHAALVLFWASWCTSCQREAPAVERFARSAAGRGRIVGIDYGESDLAAARAFIRRYGWTFPSFGDPDGEAGEAYGVTSLPTTFAIDARGRISARLSGPQTERSLTRALAAAG
jgi:thiol-disulfide isomerase/thioredoxin